MTEREVKKDEKRERKGVKDEYQEGHVRVQGEKRRDGELDRRNGKISFKISSFKNVWFCWKEEKGGRE